MPITDTITAFYSFTAGETIRSAYQNNNFNVFRGHLIAVDGSLSALAVTKSYDLGSSGRYWRAGYIGNTITDTLTATTIVGTSINATTIVGTTITATSLVTTTLTAASIQTTSITSSSMNTGTLTASSIVGTTITATTAVATSLTVSSQINLTGGKLQFPAVQSASADANCLDDYEEQTWTPVLTAGTGTITSYTSEGRYQKIGNRVYFTARGTLTNAGTGAGLRMTLPITAATGVGTYVASGRETVAAGNAIHAEIAAAGTYMSVFLYNNANACVTNYNNVISGFYEV